MRRFEETCLPRLRRRFHPQLVLAFGSRVRGDAIEDSDLDLLIVAESFRGVPFLERAAAVLAAADPPFPVDVLCYTPGEFQRKREELGIVSAAVEEGVAL